MISNCFVHSSIIIHALNVFTNAEKAYKLKRVYGERKCADLYAYGSSAVLRGTAYRPEYDCMNTEPLYKDRSMRV